MTRALATTTAVLGALALGACSGEGSSPGAVRLMDGATPGGDTWESFAKPFFSEYCTGCHGYHRNYETRAHIERDADTIRCGVAPEPLPLCPTDNPSPGMFPLGDGPQPTESERWRLVDWIDAGMP